MSLCTDVFSPVVHRGPGHFRWQVPAFYVYDSGMVCNGAEAKPFEESNDVDAIDHVLFGAMDGWSFQHFVQDIWYAINASRQLLCKIPDATICVPDFPEAENLLRMIGLAHRVHRLPVNAWFPFARRALVVNFVPKPAHEHLSTFAGWLTPKTISMRADLWREVCDPMAPWDTVIFICRPPNGPRAWDNETALCSLVRGFAEKNGFRFVRFAPHEPEQSDSTVNRLRMFQRARGVVAVHGGAAYHVVACRPGTFFLEVTVPNSHSFDWWIESCQLDYHRERVATGSHDSLERVRLDPQRMMHLLRKGIPCINNSCSALHLVVQPYRDPHPERDAEIMECLRRNLGHADVLRVHALLEHGQCLPKDIACHPKLHIVWEQQRMTFASAFAFVQSLSDRWNNRDVVMIANADVHVDGDNWSSLCHDGKVHCLSKFEEDKDGNKAMYFETFLNGNSFDAWVFPANLPLGVPPDCDFRVGNELGCDGAIVERILRQGYSVVNDSVTHRLVHIDRCAHRGRETTCTFDQTKNTSSEDTIQTFDVILNQRGNAMARVLCESIDNVALCDDKRNCASKSDAAKTFWMEQRDIRFPNGSSIVIQQTPARIIRLHAINGLANRIKALVSAIRLAGNAPALVFMERWPIDEREDAHWSKLFDIQLSTTDCEKTNASEIYGHGGWRLELTAEDKALLPENNFASMRQFGNHDGHWRQIDFEFYRIPKALRERYLQSFAFVKPVKPITNIVTSFLHAHGFAEQNTVCLGVQVRLWNDDPVRRCGSELEELRDALERFKDMFCGPGNSKRVKVFLASDTLDQACQCVQQVFPDHVTFHAAPLFDTKLEAAWCEMLLLSRMEHLIVTRASTFGEVAWWLGGAKANVFAQIGNGV